jgi:hypothetical protein
MISTSAKAALLLELQNATPADVNLGDLSRNF